MPQLRKRKTIENVSDGVDKRESREIPVLKQSKKKTSATSASRISKIQKPSTNSHSKRKKNVSNLSSDDESPKFSKKKSIAENLSPRKDPKLTRAKVVLHSLNITNKPTDSEKAKVAENLSTRKDSKLTKAKVVLHSLNVKDEPTDSEKNKVAENLSSLRKDPKLTRAKVLLHSLNTKDETSEAESFLFDNSMDSGISSETSINMSKDDSKPDVVLKSESTDLSSSNQQCKDESSSSESEWEEVEDHCEASLDDYKPDIPKEGVEITIDCPDLHIRKRRKKQIDKNEWIRLRINRVRKSNQLSVHKTHLLCLLAHGIYVNEVLNSDSVKGFALSLIPNDMLSFTSGKKVDKIGISGIEKVVSWFCDTFTFENEKCLFLNIFLSTVTSFVNKKSKNSSEYNLMFIVIARILGFKVRFCESLYPVNYKASNLIKKPNNKKHKKSLPAEENEKSEDTEHDKASNLIEKPTSKKYKKSLPIEENEKREDTEPETSQKRRIVLKKAKAPKISKEKKQLKSDKLKKKKDTKILRPRRSKGKNYKISSDEDDNSDDKDFEMGDYQSSDEDDHDFKMDDYQNSDKDDHFKVDDYQSSNDESSPKTNSKCKRRPRKKSSNRKVLPSDSKPSSPEKSVLESGNIICWAEIYSKPDKQWICIECTNNIINKPYVIEALAPQPISYILAFDNESYVKDVTRRYCINYMTDTIKLRVDPEWWEDTLEPFLPPNSAQNRAEEKKLDEMLVNKPLPTNIQGFKNHPLYALKRHMLKYEAIYPPDAPPVGFIRGEAVYARDCIHRLQSRERWWMKEARVIRIGEEPYRIVKTLKWDKIARVIRKDVPLEVFGIWQTEPYEPPTAANGKVPRNEYGNVELFKPNMLPRGTVHLQLPGLNRIAKKLGIDCSPAIVGFDIHKGGVHPIMEGFVICEEFKDTITSAWEEEQENAREREKEKREKRIYGNWKKMIKGLLIRERIKLKYAVQ